MNSSIVNPAFSAWDQAVDTLKHTGYAVLSPCDVLAVMQSSQEELSQFQASWNDLPPDNFLMDSGKYRYRRHSCFIREADNFWQATHRAHWQPIEFNALNGGIRRAYQPVNPEIIQTRAWLRTLNRVADLCSAAKPVRRWCIEAHQFRIATSNGKGLPTPEGTHRDGVDFVAILLADRCGIEGGENRIFEANGPQGIRFTLQEPWTLLIIDDHRMIHETTPIQSTDGKGYRDTLVLTLREGKFLGD